MSPIEKAQLLKDELNSLRPIAPEDEQRIMQKFRLDWNYHSNNLEGNSLTYGETKALILFGITAQGKPLKDHFEITGHNEAVLWVEEVVKEDRPLTQHFIRELHTLILKEPYEAHAITPDGKPTKKWVHVGNYKTTPNHVKTRTGEIFRFATPEETPALMQDLLDWYNSEKERADMDPILLAIAFHYRFIRIHPFDDGNGRTARILMNFILMQHGYPPAIIKTEEKGQYIAALEQADAGIFEPFVEYIGNNLVRSLEIMIKGAKGEPVEEPDDIDKEISMLDYKLRNAGKRIEKYKSEETIKEFGEKELVKIIDAFLEAGSSFENYFFEIYYWIDVDGRSPKYVYKHDFSSTFLETLNAHYNHFYFHLNAEFRTLNYIGFEDQSMTINVELVFERSLVYVKTSDFKIQALYSEEINTEEIDKLKKALKKEGKEKIEAIIKEKEG